MGKFNNSMVSEVFSMPDRECDSTWFPLTKRAPTIRVSVVLAVAAAVRRRFHPPEALTRNRQKNAFRVSEKHTSWPNLCHTHCVTAITRQPAGAHDRVPQVRGSAESAADPPALSLPSPPRRIASTRAAILQRFGITSEPARSFPPGPSSGGRAVCGQWPLICAVAAPVPELSCTFPRTSPAQLGTKITKRTHRQNGTPCEINASTSSARFLVEKRTHRLPPRAAGKVIAASC